MESRRGHNWKLFLLGMGVLFLAGCGSVIPAAPSTPRATPSPAHSTGGAKSPGPVSCANVPVYGSSFYTPGSAGDLPSTFPWAYSGATMCGTVAQTGTTYYISAAPGSDIINYYHAALKAAGYTVSDVTVGCAPTHQTFDFQKQGVAHGQVYTTPDEGMYTVVYVVDKP